MSLILLTLKKKKSYLFALAQQKLLIAIIEFRVFFLENKKLKSQSPKCKKKKKTNSHL